MEFTTKLINLIFKQNVRKNIFIKRNLLRHYGEDFKNRFLSFFLSSILPFFLSSFRSFVLLFLRFFVSSLILSLFPPSLLSFYLPSFHSFFLLRIRLIRFRISYNRKASNFPQFSLKAICFCFSKKQRRKQKKEISQTLL